MALTWPVKNPPREKLEEYAAKIRARSASRLPRRIAEGLAEARFDRRRATVVWFCAPRCAILIAPITDAELAGARPVPAVRDAVEQARAVGVAAAGRDRPPRRPARGGTSWRLPPAKISEPLAPSVHDQRLDVARERLQLAAGLLLQHLAFVVVHRDVSRRAARTRRAPRRRTSAAPGPGSNMNGIAGCGAFARVLQHALLAVGRDDGEPGAERRGHVVLVRWFIAPGWKAVIWLSSRSVVMNACAVNWPGMRLEQPRCRCPEPRSAAR